MSSTSQGESSAGNEPLSSCHGVWQVEPQHACRGSSFRCPAFDPTQIDLKMVTPALAAGIEQPRDFAGGRVDGGQVRAFEAIAEKAGPGQILRHGETTVFDGDDVVGFVRQKDLFLTDQTVLAAKLGTTASKLSKRCRNFVTHGVPIIAGGPSVTASAVRCSRTGVVPVRHQKSAFPRCHAPTDRPLVQRRLPKAGTPATARASAATPETRPLRPRVVIRVEQWTCDVPDCCLSFTSHPESDRRGGRSRPGGWPRCRAASSGRCRAFRRSSRRILRACAASRGRSPPGCRCGR